MTRRQAATLLWDGTDDATTLGNLRQLLVRTRRGGTSEEILGSDPSHLWLGPAAAGSIDACAFDEFSASEQIGQIQSAIELFRGDLLAGAEEMSDGFSHWLAQERAALREQYFAAVSRSLIELTRYGAAPVADLRAIERHVLGVEPDREASYRSLIEAYGRNGMKEDAARIYRALQTVLEREFGASVSSETRAVFRRVSSAMDIVAPEPGANKSAASKRRVAFLPIALLAHTREAALLRAVIEDVANNLSRYRTLTVLAPHSSFQLADQPDPQARLAEFEVDYQVSGFLLPDGRSLALRMSHVRSGEILWAAEYPVDAQKLAATFRMLSRQVAATLAERIEHHRIGSLELEVRPEAYNCFLQGQAHLSSVDLGPLRRARSAFRSAVEHQAEFAPAHARIAQTLYLEWLLLGGDDPQLLAAAKAEANAAIATDAGGGDGHWMLGVTSLYQRDFDSAAEHFATAESLNPNAPDLLVQYADALANFGDVERGWQCFERSIELNPLPPDHYWWAGGSIALAASDYQRAIELCGKMVSDEPAVQLLAICHALAGNNRAARDYGERVKQNYPGLSAAAMARRTPTRDRAATEKIFEGLRMAGIE